MLQDGNRNNEEPQDTHEERVFMVCDINNSTAVKQDKPEMSWVNSTLEFYQKIHSKVANNGGEVVKFLGDGAMVTFEASAATEAINTAIEIQEEYEEDREGKRDDLTCSISIAYGTTRGIVIGETVDYLGSTIDRAFRLCDAANANAIFVDENMIDAASMTRVGSKLGTVLRRNITDYRGEMQSIEVKGFKERVAYHEILWHKDRYGVSAKFVTSTPTAPTPVLGDKNVSNPGVPEKRADKDSWLKGYVKRWTEGKFGFITTSSGDDYFFDERLFFLNDTELVVGSEVLFKPAPPIQEGKGPRASDILLIGSTVVGMILIPEGKNFGFIDIAGSVGNRVGVFVGFGQSSTSIVSRDQVECTLQSGPKGPMGTNPAKIED